MTTIVNLRQAKKRLAAAKKRAQADANAVRHGRTRAERLAEAAETERARLTLDAHRREPGDKP